MQIIEVSSFSVRSAMMRFEPQLAGPVFLLFPMVHVADPKFYDEVSEGLDECDLILCEGVKSPTASLLTSAYRYFAGNPRLGLVQQRTMDLSHVQDRLIHADVSGAAFEHRWSQLSFWLRYGIPVIAPFLGLYVRFFGTREFLAKGLRLNLKQSRREVLAEDDEQELKEVLLDWRDQHLLSVLERERIRAANKDAIVGILFGAEHMRAVINYLSRKHRYRPVASNWATVFDL